MSSQVPRGGGPRHLQNLVQTGRSAALGAAASRLPVAALRASFPCRAMSTAFPAPSLCPNAHLLASRS